MDLNRISLTGRATKDPELRTTNSGSSVLSLSLAFNDRTFNPSTKEWEDQANFIDCAVFGERAESLSNLIKKGSRLAVGGKLRWRRWEAKDGTKRTAHSIFVTDLVLLGDPKKRDDAHEKARQTLEDELGGEEIPF